MMCVIRSFREQITHALLIQVNNTDFGMDRLHVVAILSQMLKTEMQEAHKLVHFSSENMYWHKLQFRFEF